MFAHQRFDLVRWMCWCNILVWVLCLAVVYILFWRTKCLTLANNLSVESTNLRHLLLLVLVVFVFDFICSFRWAQIKGTVHFCMANYFIWFVTLHTMYYEPQIYRVTKLWPSCTLNFGLKTGVLRLAAFGRIIGSSLCCVCELELLGQCKGNRCRWYLVC